MHGGHSDAGAGVSRVCLLPESSYSLRLGVELEAALAVKVKVTQN